MNVMKVTKIEGKFIYRENETPSIICICGCETWKELEEEHETHACIECGNINKHIQVELK